MRITVLTAMWGRPQVTAIMLRNLYELRPVLAEDDIELTTVVVGSEGEWSRWLARAFDADYVGHKNKPLGAKWNAGLAKVRSHNPDALVILGSDNIANAALFRTWAQGLSDGIDYQGILDSFQYHPQKNVLVHWHGYTDDQRKGEPGGSARCWSKALLARVKWLIWEPGYNRGLDWSATQLVKKTQHTERFIRIINTEVRHLGIKTQGTMSPFVASAMPKKNLRDPALLVDWFGPIGQQVLDLQDW